MFDFAPDHLAALAAFAFVASFTPGPNNMMLLASGVNYGFWPTIPHMLGIIIGFCVLLACVGLGIGALFEAYPQISEVLKILGAAYLLYLAWGIATAGAPDAAIEERSRPLTTLEAAAFQWVNPKAWVVGLSAMTIYTVPNRYSFSVFLVVLIFGAVSIGATTTWTVFGVALSRLLANETWRRAFNIVMGLLLAATLIPIFL